jgi:hypothetical protein
MTPATNPNSESPSLETLLSAAQLAANRQNAQKSTGPKTEAGKQRCRINATRHGLTGQFHAFSREDKAAFDRHCAALLEDLQPATYREKLLAVSIAEDQWRLNRARALENNIFAIGMSGGIADATDADSPEVHAAVCQARVWLADGNKIQLLALYETRLRRNLEKNEKQLAELQAARRAERHQDLEKAKLLARLCVLKDEPYIPTPGQNGFEFSAPEIHRLLHLDQRLQEAAAFFGRNHGNPGRPYPPAPHQRQAPAPPQAA